MSQRVAKVESLIRHSVAAALAARLERARDAVTVTGVDAAPDLKHAIIWLSILEVEDASLDQLWAEVMALRAGVQAELAETMKTKFVPRLEFRLDESGKHAEHIEGLLKQL